MKILYIYPHPDDESFGPGSVMHKQASEGHEVYLLTLTKGGATRQREKYGYSVKKMGNVRVKEMEKVAKVLGLNELKVLDLPDSGLKEMDPREIEDAIRLEINRIEPYVIVTYPVHGISGFHDHLVTHAVVKRLFLEMKEKKWFLKRLAFTTLTKEVADKGEMFNLNHSSSDEIDCVIKVEKSDISAVCDALDCYKTFKETIDQSKIKTFKTEKEYFELFNENFNPPLNNLFDKLPSE
jgi:LmbE family N-acetylglucosaminyl deacetylase